MKMEIVINIVQMDATHMVKAGNSTSGCGVMNIIQVDVSSRRLLLSLDVSSLRGLQRLQSCSIVLAFWLLCQQPWMVCIFKWKFDDGMATRHRAAQRSSQNLNKTLRTLQFCRLSSGFD